jgi:predicted kinase
MVSGTAAKSGGPSHPPRLISCIAGCTFPEPEQRNRREETRADSTEMSRHRPVRLADAFGKERYMTTEGGGPRLIIVCGLPGAGKTTRAKQLERALHGVRFCPDDWMEQLAIDVWDEPRRARIEAFQWNLGQQLLTFGLTVIVEWGTWARSERDALRLGARALGAAVELHYVSAPIDALFDRIQRRGIEDPPITREQVQRWAEIIDAPTPEEMALYDEPSKTS